MANYWIKAYTEILDDPKMGTLPDRLWRRVMELFLLAGKFHDGGHLPDTKQLAWVLRMTTDDLDFDLKQIEQTGIIKRTPTGWYVVHFAERQAAVPGAKRIEQFRNREHSKQYAGNDENVTNLKRNVTQITDTDTETEAEEESRAPAPASPPQKSIMNIIASASNLSAIPPTESARLEQIHCLVDVHGAEKVEAALKSAVSRWRTTKNKQGRTYPVTNFGWVDWAQQELDKAPQERPMSEWTVEEVEAYYAGRNA